MPAGSSLVEVSWGFPVLQVSVVGEDGKGMLGPSQVVSPMGEHFHHGKQLSLIDVIVTLCRGKGGRVVSDRVEFRFSFLVQGCISFASFLGEYCSNPICRSISLQIEAVFEIGLNEDWSLAHKGFEHFEHFELGFSPMPYYTFLCQVEKWMGNFGIVRDKVVVVPCESQEGVNISGVFGQQPVCYTT